MCIQYPTAEQTAAAEETVLHILTKLTVHCCNCEERSRAAQSPLPDSEKQKQSPTRSINVDNVSSMDLNAIILLGFRGSVAMAANEVKLK